MSESKTTLFRWKIEGFNSRRKASWRDETDLNSSNFQMVTRPTVQFALNIGLTPWDFVNRPFAIVLKQMNDNESVNVNAKVWLENENGQKFGESSAEKLTFNKIGDQWKYNGSNEDDYKNFVEPLRKKREALIVCCELIDLDAPAFPTELSREFRQKNWALYENGIHDAIIKIGNREFKVLKSFFMGQSEVFKQMFLSNFKEGLTSTIDVKDVSEQAMLALIKWFYTEQVEDWSTVEHLFAASDKYDISVLKKTCTQHLISTLDEENVFQRLVLAVKHNDNALKESALDCISKLSTASLLKFTMSNEWIDFSTKHNALAKEVSSLVRQKFNI